MIKRQSEALARALTRGFPIVAFVGPRQSGKTTLARGLFGDRAFVSLEDPEEREYALRDPRGFLARFPEGAVIDEAQRCPALFSYLQGLVDARRRMGDFILTGSQQFGLRSGISHVHFISPLAAWPLHEGGLSLWLRKSSRSPRNRVGAWPIPAALASWARPCSNQWRKIMNKLLSASAIGLMAIATTALAQPWGGYGPGQGAGWGGPGADVDFRVERMTTMLGLSPGQQDQLREIFKDQQSRRQAMRQSMQAQVDAILTPEQRERHAQMMQGRGFGGRGPGWGGGGGRGLGPCGQGLPPPTTP